MFSANQLLTQEEIGPNSLIGEVHVSEFIGNRCLDSYMNVLFCPIFRPETLLNLRISLISYIHLLLPLCKASMTEMIEVGDNGSFRQVSDYDNCSLTCVHPTSDSETSTPHTSSALFLTVEWKYGNSHPRGVAAEVKTHPGEKVQIQSQKGNTITRNADEDNAAVRVERRGDGNIKMQSSGRVN